eukprot:TRINITY_DN25235_c0_g1_i1.p1 TRINITY_DN25235_c0_g1~~TRINITY_DN25235_c0_g1_i1.p1  ORF type:complete len:423 (+),score=83.54 TRINITY_DN25235_c0_g1_i1:94-1362(+)
MADGMLRSPTFLVGTEQQRSTLAGFHRSDQHLSEEYSKNKPLCFNGRAFQKTHPGKAKEHHRDADATLASPMMLGVADGVSQIEEYGIDASELPKELLSCCEELALLQLTPGVPVPPQDSYKGPISLLRRAFEGTEALGSTTALLAVLDNSTRIHGKLHPMVAVITVGDCELLLLRRYPSSRDPMQVAFHTEMQRIDGHAQTPLQLARVDARIDPDFDDDITIEVIERGSAVHCVSAYEGDIVIMGSDGVFDNLFLDEVVDLANSVLSPSPGKFFPTDPRMLEELAQKIVFEAHRKSIPRAGGYADSPIGKGGKMDDTSVVVGEIVEWTDTHERTWGKIAARARKTSTSKGENSVLGLFGCGNACSADAEVDDYDDNMHPSHSYGSHGGSFHGVGVACKDVSRDDEGDDDDDDDGGGRCVVS